MLQSVAQAQLEKLIELGIALSAERDHDRLLERLLTEAQNFAQADGGTLYLVDEERQVLDFKIVRNHSLKIALGGTTGEPISFPPLPLVDPDSGAENHSNVATHVALSQRTIVIPDAYEADGFDFSGTRRFDAGTGYRSQSFVTVPMQNSEGRVIGVLQLINALDSRGKVGPFAGERVRLIEALASQAAIALENQMLLRAQKALLDAFIQVMARSIDNKSPYTSKHCQRVPVITKMLAQTACASDDQPFADFSLDDDQWYELHLAAWLHDCGKIAVPEHIADKATKLETVVDRIELIRTRVEVLRRDAELNYLRKRGAPGADPAALEATFRRQLAVLDDALAFLESCNTGGEFLADEAIARLETLAKWRWRDRHGTTRSLITDDELMNLSIRKGTLNDAERKIINSHISVTIEILEQLPFPAHLRRVPEFAGGHHEKMDGSGYPRGLTRDEMSIPARIMAIADIFEALTSADRPYKKAKPLSEAIAIMAAMKRDHHIDPDLFDLFLRSGVWEAYAKRYVDPAQLDEPDIAGALAVRPEPRP